MIFNKSIVISLKSAEERRQRIIDQNINHEFFDAIDGSSMSDDEFRANVSNEGYDEYIKNDKKRNRSSINKTGLGLCLSWKSIVENITEPTLIMEDDVVVCDNFYKKLNAAVRFVPMWDVLYLSWNNCDWPIGKKINEYATHIVQRPLEKSKGDDVTVHGTGALIIHNKCKDSFLSMFPASLSIDSEICNKLIRTKKINSYLLRYKSQRLAINDNLGGSEIGDETEHKWSDFKGWNKKQ